MTPLLVHENYLTVNTAAAMPPGVPPARAAMMTLQRMATASDFLASADTVGARILKEQLWALAPLHGVLSCVAPGFHMQGNLGRVQFPSWLGRNSTATKRQRQLREATCHMQAAVSGSNTEVRASYIPALRPRLLAPMLRRGGDGCAETIELMDEYNLSKDDFDAIMELELLAGNGGKPAFAAVPTAAKSALTRQYNQKHADVSKAAKKPKAAGKALPARYSAEGEEADDRGDDDDDDDDGEGEGDDDDFAAKGKAAAAKPAAAKGKQPVGKGKGKAKA